MLFIYERFIVKNTLRFYWEKICSIQYLYFSFEKHVPSQSLKDFSVENLETTSSTFLSKFSSEIYLSRIINYWGSIYRSVSFVFCPCFIISFIIFFLFLSIFSLTDTSDSRGYKERRGNPYFSCFPLPLPHYHIKPSPSKTNKANNLNAIFYSYTAVYSVETILWLNLLCIY